MERLTARKVAGRARRTAIAGWEAVRPFPLPAYLRDTPSIGGANAFDPFLPPTIQTLAEAATSDAAIGATLAALEKLTPSDFHEVQQYYMSWGRAKYAPYWRLANLITTVWASAKLIQPKAYLEIGVQRGRSAAVLASVTPACDIYGFDLWIPGYAGIENPGPDFVAGELRTAGHTGSLTLTSGDSRRTVPAFMRAHPGLFFDLITIDGDKSLVGIASDFQHTLPRLKVGGIVIFDDMPVKPVLRRVWNRVVHDDRRYADWEFISGDHGVAAAVRVRP